MLKKLLPCLILAGTAHAADSVRIYNWTDYIAPDTLKQFEKSSGLGTHYDVYDSNETLDAKLMAGRSGYDVVFPSNHFMARQIQGGALKKLDRSKLPNWNNLSPVLMKTLEVNDPGNEHGFPYLWGSTGIGYNVDKVRAVLGDDVKMDSWDVLFDPAKLAKLNICMAVGFSGDIMQAGARAAEAGNGVKIQYEIPKEGAPIWFDMVAMPVDASNEEGGYAYMNYLLQPEVMAAISNHVKYANGNAKADALVDPALKADPTVYPPEAVMDKLYTLEAMPLKIDRVRTRIWSKAKSGV